MCARTAWVADARRRQNTADGAFSRHSGTSASHPASAKQTQTARDARCRGAPRATETLGRRGKSSKEGRPLHWTACMASAHRGGRAYTRTGLATVGLVASFAALPVAADAALTIQPNAPALGFPASVDDTVAGFSLTSCQDNSGFCVETPAPNPTQPLSVPDNYPPDGEAFYQIAEATVPNAGIGLARFALEQAFTTADPVAGQQIMFGRIRFRFQGLKPGTKYRMTHPYGVDEIVADGGGIINSTEDLGCLGPPCDFTTANYGRITSFLQWDPTVAPAPPAGYIGNFAVPHKVIGGPGGTNFVRVGEPPAVGAVAGLVGETDSFLVQGKLAGAAPAAAPFVVPDSKALTFSGRQVGSASPTANVTLANHGTAPLSVTSAAIGGTDAGDFSVAANGCATDTAPGASCTIGVGFTPQATGVRTATLTVAGNALNGPHTFTLTGSGTPAQLPAPAPVVIQAPAPGPLVVQAPGRPLASAAATTARNLRVARRVRLRQARAGGITITFQAPANAKVARVRVVKPGTGRAVATKLVTLERTGRQTVHVRVRGVRAGRYRVEVATGRSASALSRAATSLLTLTR